MAWLWHCGEGIKPRSIPFFAGPRLIWQIAVPGFMRGDMIRANAAPGYQSFSQDQVALYPTDPSGQGLLDSLKARNSDVRSFYDSISKTGFALSADGSIYYRVSPGTRVGGEIGINTFGTYDEFKSLIGIRQSLGGAK